MNNSFAEVRFQFNIVKVLESKRHFSQRWGSVYTPTVRSKGLPTQL